MVHGQLLKTNADFDNAILFGIAVSVTEDGHLVGSGHVTSYTYHVVKMENGYFFKDTCVFTVCSVVIKNRNT
jgi:azurin